MRRWILPVVGVTLVLVGVLGMAATAALSHLGVGRTEGRTDGEPIERRPGGVDAMFIEEMIPHHEDAIAMGEIALEQAEHPELQELARTIVRDQSAEVEQMAEWYEEWFGTRVPESEGRSGMGPMMGGDVDLDAFAGAEPFDKAFIEEMVPHHRMGIMMARMMRAQTDEPRMRELADSIIRSQSEEIDRMVRWYDEWYGP